MKSRPGPLSGTLLLCASLIGCAGPANGPDDREAEGRRSLLIVIVDEVPGTAGLDAGSEGWCVTETDRSVTCFERHYADRSLRLALPAIIEPFVSTGYSSFAITDKDPPAFLQTLTLLVDEAFDAERLDDTRRIDALGEALKRHPHPFLAYLRLRRVPAKIGDLFQGSERASSTMLVVTADRAASGSLAETAIRVPLVVSFPVGGADSSIPSEVTVPTGHSDLAVGLVRWFGVGDAGSEENGHLLSGTLPDHVFVPDETGWAVLSGDLKLVQTSSGRRLHDLSLDPAESLDLAARLPDEVDRLAGLGAVHLEQYGEALDPEERERLEELRSLGYIQ